jgi:hypothetical protein
VTSAGAQQEPSPPGAGDNADAGETSSVALVDTSDQAMTVDTQSSTHLVFLPLISIPMPPSPFGFDVRTHAPDGVMPLVVEANPRWSRAGDVLWALVEPVRGGGYRWEAIADVERNVRRLRAMGIEPTLIVQWSPSWAQSIPGKLCSAPRPDAIPDFAAFMRAAAQRFSSGDLRVDHWEIWNEPDFRPDEVVGNEGVGCWATYDGPYYGGDYYGQVLRAVYPAVKAGNPNAQVWGGALMHRCPMTRTRSDSCVVCWRPVRHSHSMRSVSTPMASGAPVIFSCSSTGTCDACSMSMGCMQNRWWRPKSLRPALLHRSARRIFSAARQTMRRGSMRRR